MKSLVIVCATLITAPVFSQMHASVETTGAMRSARNAPRIDVVGTPSAYAVKLLDFNGPGMDFSPSPYRDGIVFVSSRSKKEVLADQETFLNLFYTSESEDGTFAVPAPLEAEIISPYHEGPVFFFADGTKKIITRNALVKKSKAKDGSVSPLELAISGLTPSGKWSEPIALPFVNPGYSVGHPAMSSDGKTLYFSSNMPGTVGESDLFVSRLEDGVWTKPENLGSKINTSGQELFPYIYRDSLLFFASNGHGGMGGLDIFYCDLKTADRKMLTFSAPVNSAADDFGILVERQGTSGFFSSNREGGRGQDDIYYFEEVQPFIEIQMYDSVTHHPVMHASVVLSAPGYRSEVTSDAFGKAAFRIRPMASSTLIVRATGYATADRQLVASALEAAGDNRITVQLAPLALPTRYATTGLGYSGRSGLSNVISFDSRPLDVDVQHDVPIPAEDPRAGADSISSPALNVIAVEVINDLPALMLVRNDSIFETTVSSESILRNAALGIGITIPQGAKRHDYEEIIRKQIDAHGYVIGTFLLIRSFFFDSGKTWVRNDASAQLDKIIEVMVAHPEVHLQMTFHADSRGTDAFNLDLSKARAEAVTSYLGKAGIKSERISSRFVGESQPLNDCGDLSDCNDLLHQINRTAEFKLLLR